MRIARRYTSGFASPYQGVGFRKLPYLDGQKARSWLGDSRYAETYYEFPESWPEDVCATFFRRCAALAGSAAGRKSERPSLQEDDVPHWLRRGKAPTTGDETDARQTIDRLAGELTWWGWKSGYFDADGDAAAFFDELRHMLCHRMVAPEIALWSHAGRLRVHDAGWDERPMFVMDFQNARIARADENHAANWSDDPWSVAVFNLREFLGEDGGLDAECLAHAARLWTIALDISIHMTSRGKPRDAERDWSIRPISLEPANLSCLLLAMGLAYDSAAGRSVGVGAMALISGAAHCASAEMAGELGAAPGYRRNNSGRINHVVQCRQAARELSDDRTAFAARQYWDQCLGEGDINGFRNLRISVTPSQRDACRLLDTEAEGIEPGFSLVKYSPSHDKDDLRGGIKKYLNPHILTSLVTLGYTPVQIKDITHHILGRGTLESAPGINHHIMLMAGFDVDAVLAAEGASCVVTNIRHAFGVEDLETLSFSRDQIDQANRYCCGAMTFDGAPHILPKHFPVFAGAGDMDEILAASRDRMLRAMQPFLDSAGVDAASHPLPGIRRGRFIVYEGGATKHEPKRDLPAKSR